MHPNPSSNTVTAVSELNTLMGNVYGAKLQRKEFLEGVRCQTQLVREEFLEELFMEAESDIEVIDAIGDSITVVDGLPFRFGVKITDAVFQEVVSVSAINPHGDVENRAYDMALHTINTVSELLTSLETLATIRSTLSHKTFERAFITRWSQLRKIVEMEAVWWRKVHPLRAFLEVHRSNMSKLCNGEKEVQETMNHYRIKYCFFKDEELVVKEVAKDKFAIVAAIDLQMGDKLVKAGKFLKNVHYSPADFSNVEHYKF